MPLVFLLSVTPLSIVMQPVKTRTIAFDLISSTNNLRGYPALYIFPYPERRICDLT